MGLLPKLASLLLSLAEPDILVFEKSFQFDPLILREEALWTLEFFH